MFLSFYEIGRKDIYLICLILTDGAKIVGYKLPVWRMLYLIIDE